MDIRLVEWDINRVTFSDAERQRQDLDPDGIKELAKSIETVGLINPIIIDSDGRLIAGRRRLEAHRLLGRSVILVRFKDELTPLELAILEFDENHKRKQLTWQEEAAAVAKIKAMMESEYAQATVQSSNATPTIERLAERLGVSTGKVSEDLLLSTQLSNVRVTNRPSRRGALQTVKRERELELIRELARRRASNIGLGSSETQTTFAQGIVYNGDCREILAGMEENSVDLIITDPPWGVGLHESSQWTKKWVPQYSDDTDEVRKVLIETFPLLYRVLKPTNHLYIYFPIQELAWWIDQLCKAGFMVRPRPLVWFKAGQPSISDVYAAFLPVYEVFLFAWKPGTGDIRRLFSRPVPEGLYVSRASGLWHENEKPLDVLKPYIETSSSPDEVVLDPFGGGGSTAIAAYELGRYFVTIEKDPVSYDKITRRVREFEEGREPPIEE